MATTLATSDKGALPSSTSSAAQPARKRYLALDAFRGFIAKALRQSGGQACVLAGPISKQPGIARLAGVLEFLAKHDFADPAFHLQPYRGGSFSIRIVRVGIVLVLQSVRINAPDSTRSVDNDADVFRQPDVRLAHAT